MEDLIRLAHREPFLLVLIAVLLAFAAYELGRHGARRRRGEGQSLLEIAKYPGEWLKLGTFLAGAAHFLHSYWIGKH